MLHRLRQAGLSGRRWRPSSALGVLVSLGTWQVQRLQWKDGLIAKIAARTQAAPSTAAGRGARRAAATSNTCTSRSAGRLLNDKERHLYAPTTSRASAVTSITPLETRLGPARLGQPRLRARRPQGPGDARRGPVPGDGADHGLASRRADAQACSLRPTMSARNIWYWPDIDAMAALGLPRARAPRGPALSRSTPTPARSRPAAAQGRRDPPRPAQPSS